ncbi:MAG: hypothetical protein WC781_03590 [Candidatus Pacearchaeota archaeon]|jgi:hypothetical protein
MIVKVLGALDIIIAILLLILCSRVPVPNEIIFIAMVILFIKGIPALINFDIGSFFDIYAGLILLISIFLTVPVIFLLLACFLLLQKGIFSML